MDRISMPSLFLRLAGAALAGALSTAIAAAAPGSQPIAVVVDHAKVMHIARPADIVIIGNPGIADATIQDSQTLIITGKSFGTTNLIVLDAQGQAIAEELVSVQPNDDDIVTVYKVDKDKGMARESFSCTPACSPTMSLGDANDWFTGVHDQIQARASVANPAAGQAK